MPIMRNINLITVHFWTYLVFYCSVVIQHAIFVMQCLADLIASLSGLINGAKTNCGITHILGIPLELNSLVTMLSDFLG